MLSNTIRAARILALGAVVMAGPASAAWSQVLNKAGTIPAGVHAVAASSATPVHIAVPLRVRDPAGLDALALAVNTPGNPAYGRFLTPMQFRDRFAPSPSAAKAVVAHLEASGFRNVAIAPNRLLITADGTAAQAQRAFGVKLQQFAWNGKTVLVNTTGVRVPAALAGTVLGVHGLNTLPHRQLSPHASAIGNPSLDGIFFFSRGLSPQQFEAAYGATGTPRASDTVIAVFAFGDMTAVKSHLLAYEAEFGVPHTPVTEVKSVAGGAYTDTSGGTEWDMDVQTSTGLAGGAKELIIYNGDDFGSDADWIINFTRFVTDNRAKGGSMSAGGCEALEWLFSLTDALDPVFQQAATQGQTLFFSTGDTGPTCFNPATGPAGGTNGVTDSGIPGQTYPASSPWAIAVGGTTLSLDTNNNRNAEIAWNAGGGGPSQFEIAPPWQAGKVPGASGKLQARGVPDIAMDADFLLSGAAIVDDFGADSNGGTSLSTPLALGAWARIQTAHCNELGFAGPLLYAQAPGLAKAAWGFYDIKAGTNGLYVATPGWDFTTGLGSINVAALSSLLPKSASCP